MRTSQLSIDSCVVCGLLGPVNLTHHCRDVGAWLEDIIFILPMLSSFWLFTIHINQHFSPLEETYIFLNRMHCATYPRGTDICGGLFLIQPASQVSLQATINHQCNFQNWLLSFFGVAFPDVPREIRFLNL